jgi:hypothetical protein
MKKNTLNRLIPSALAIFVLNSAGAQTPASLENRGQEKQNWCWNACSEMILDWSGFDVTQLGIADWAVDGKNVGNFLDTGADGVGPYVDTDTGKTFFRQGIKQVLEHFGPVSSQRMVRPLTWDEVKNQLSANRPFIYAVYWIDAKKRVRGGHVGVGKDFSDADEKLVAIEDPWPMDNFPRSNHRGISAIVPYDVIVGSATISYSKAVFGSDSLNNQWVETLSLSRKADVVFLVDTTGSMGPYIDNVKARASEMLNILKEQFSDLRVAVVDYRDGGTFTDYPDDYILSVRQPMTSDIALAQTGINSLDLGSGGDGPESLYSAVYQVSKGAAKSDDGTAMGVWRTGSEVSRNIILMGDAPGHRGQYGSEKDPVNGWPDGKSLEDCTALLADPTTGVRVQAVHVGDWVEAFEDFKALATASGGSFAGNTGAADVSSRIKEMFEQAAAGRYPIGSSGSMFPKFTFAVPGGGGGGTPKVLTAAVDIERKLGGSWRFFARMRLPSANLAELISKTYFAPGTYRWKLSGTNGREEEVLPNNSTAKIPSARATAFVESKYTEFERTISAPPAIAKVSAGTLTSKTSRQELTFVNDASAVAFAIQLEDVATKKKTTVIVARSGTRAGAGVGTLKAVVPCVANKAFTWKIQGLNQDRPSIDPTKWN